MKIAEQSKGSPKLGQSDAGKVMERGSVKKKFVEEEKKIVDTDVKERNWKSNFPKRSSLS